MRILGIIFVRYNDQQFTQTRQMKNPYPDDTRMIHRTDQFEPILDIPNITKSLSVNLSQHLTTTVVFHPTTHRSSPLPFHSTRESFANIYDEPSAVRYNKSKSSVLKSTTRCLCLSQLRIPGLSAAEAAVVTYLSSGRHGGVTRQRTRRERRHRGQSRD